MDSSPGSKNGRRESRLLNTNVRYEERNEADEKFEWQFSLVMAKINGFSEKESLDNLIALSNVDKASFENCCAGLVYAFLVDPERANKYLKLLSHIAPSDQWFTALCVVNMILIEMSHRLKSQVRSRLIILFSHLMRDPTCKKLDNVIMNFARFIGSDCCDTHETLDLLASFCQILIENSEWLKSLKMNASLPSVSFVTATRFLSNPALGKEFDQQKNVLLHFCEMVARDKFLSLANLGREILFHFMKLSTCPRFAAVWSDIYNEPRRICPNMIGGVADLMNKLNPGVAVPPRLPQMLQKRIEQMLKFPASADFDVHFHWINRALMNPTCSGLRVEIIRVLPLVIVENRHAYDLRATFAVFLLNSAPLPEQQMCKLAFFYDWLSFVRTTPQPPLCSIDVVLPTLRHAIQFLPQLANALIDFLVLIVGTLDPPREAQILDNVRNAIRAAEAKHANSLAYVLEHPNMNASVREAFQRRFPDIITFASSSMDNRFPAVVHQPSSDQVEAPVAAEPQKISVRDPRHQKNRKSSADVVSQSAPDKSIKAKSVSEPPLNVIESNAAVIDDDNDMDDNSDDVITADAIDTSSASSEADRAEHYIVALNDDILRELTEELDVAVRNNDGNAVEIFNKLLYAVCEKNGSIDEEQLELIAQCLLIIFDPFFSKHQFVPKDTSDDNVSEVLSNTPFYALFRLLSLIPDEDRSNYPLLVLLVQMQEKQRSLSYLMLYFLKGGRTDDDRSMNIDQDSVRLYSSFCKEKGVSVEDQLAIDLEASEADDHRLFVYLVPYVFDKFDTQVIGSAAILKVVCAHVDRAQLLSLTCDIFRESITMFRKDSFPQLITSSLEWEPLDQITLWQFIHSDSVPADWIFPVIPKLSSTKHAEAVTNTLLMLRRLSRDPTLNLIRLLFAKPAKDPFTVNALMILFDDDDSIPRIAGLLLNLARKLIRNGSLLISKKDVKGTLCVELVVAHIENLRNAYLAKITKKVETFFSHADLREMFAEIKNDNSLEQIPKKYGELFATIEIMEEERKSRVRKTGRRRQAAANNNGDSDEEEKVTRKKRRVKDESDSD